MFSSDGMIRRRIVTVAVMAVVIAVIDIAFGSTMDSLLTKVSSGEIYANSYINSSLNDSIVIMGSSRAGHHYDPEILEDAFGVTVYNAGVDKNGIILAYCYLNNILSRGEKPRLIIYDFYALHDLFGSYDRYGALGNIRPYYDRPGIREVIDDIDETEYLKLHSSAYRYNTVWLKILWSLGVKEPDGSLKGFRPKEGMMDGAPKAAEYDYEAAEQGIDPVKVKYLRRFIDICEREKIAVIFVTSPKYYRVKYTDRYRALLKKYSGRPDLELLDFQSHPAFVGNASLFIDPLYMNSHGAALFTRQLADTLLHLRP